MDRLAARIVEIAARAEQDPCELAGRLRLDDLYLATACAEGHPAAWSECEAAHFTFLRDFARRFLPDAAARDLADEIIGDLWQLRKIALFEGRSSLRTWLGTVVAHSALNVIKRRRLTISHDQAAEEGESEGALSGRTWHDSPEEQGARAVLVRLIRAALERLPAPDKLLLQLYYEQGLTLDQMQVALRASKATLSRRLKRIRDDLRTSLDRDAARVAGVSVDRLRNGLELGRLELDLAEVLRTADLQEKPGRVV